MPQNICSCIYGIHTFRIQIVYLSFSEKQFIILFLVILSLVPHFILVLYHFNRDFSWEFVT